LPAPTSWAHCPAAPRPDSPHSRYQLLLLLLLLLLLVYIMGKEMKHRHKSGERETDRQKHGFGEAAKIPVFLTK
jgi:hypothetical protein